MHHCGAARCALLHEQADGDHQYTSASKKQNDVDVRHDASLALKLLVELVNGVLFCSYLRHAARHVMLCHRVDSIEIEDIPIGRVLYQVMLMKLLVTRVHSCEIGGPTGTSYVSGEVCHA